MISDPIFRYHPSPTYDVGIVSECENSNLRNLRRQQGLRPWRSGRFGCPGFFSIASKTMNKNDTYEGKTPLPLRIMEKKALLTYSARADSGS